MHIKIRTAETLMKENHLKELGVICPIYTILFTLVRMDLHKDVIKMRVYLRCNVLIKQSH